MGLKPFSFQYQRTPPFAHQFRASTLVVVADSTTSKEARLQIKNNLIESYAQLLDKEMRGNILYTYAQFKDLSPEQQAEFKDTPTPFMMIIGHQNIGDSFIYVGPGQECCQTAIDIDIVSNSSQITKFVTRY